MAGVRLPPVPERNRDRRSQDDGAPGLDMMKGNCGARPRCLATIPSRSLAAARPRHDGGLNLTGAGKVEDMVDSLAPPGEFMVKAAADKFVNSNLDQCLRDKIKTVIDAPGPGAVGGTTNGAGNAATRRCAGRRHVGSAQRALAIWHIYKGGRSTHQQCDGDAERFDQVWAVGRNRFIAPRGEVIWRNKAITPYGLSTAFGAGSRMSRKRIDHQPAGPI